MGDMGSEAKDCNEHYRIGIVTYWDADDNYGQLLQCYALQRHLRLQGHDAFLIRYPRSQSFIDRIKFSLLPIARAISYFFSKEKYRIYTYARQEQKRKRHNTVINRQRQFDEFRSRYLVVSEKYYHSPRSLRRNPPHADVYICGSDQIWTDILGKYKTPYFLDFGGNEIKRIAYSVSMGGQRLTEPELNRVSGYLQRFSAISVRDDKTKDACVLCGRTDTVVTADPTLLLSVSEYNKLMSDASLNKGNYLFVYVLNIFSSKELYWDEVEAYMQKRKLAVCIVYSSGYCAAQELVSGHSGIYATIPEWLSYISNAACILTTSYHGVVFAVKMSRPFLAILLEGRFSSGNVRIVSFLKDLGLSERIFSPNRPFHEQMEQEIDWGCVNERLERMSRESSDFLKEAISS